MPRANRHFLPGHIWHITHRCHKKSFLLKFIRDRRAYLGWLFEAKKRFGLCILNYVVTSNHIHLLVRDTAQGVISQSMQLVAGRIGQEYNQRKARQGAFWEDRYHATAIEGDEHLRRCLVYIDLNMVRAGVVRNPGEWLHGGYREIQSPPERYSLLDLPSLTHLCGFTKIENFQRAHREWVEDALNRNELKREARWSESLAVGSPGFLEKVKTEMGLEARHREIEEADGLHALLEARRPYFSVLGPENSVLSLENAIYWAKSPAIT